jgi:hypothetical protein
MGEALASFMALVRFHAVCGKPFDEFRRDLDRAIVHSQVAHMIRHTWNHQGMSIAGPGANGKLHFKEGTLRAEVQISFPATMIKDRIVGDIRRMLESAAGGPVSVTG